ncbi:hypothetical protein IJ182_01205 [bacterium]|nr:hypothetical protein [bacterium]
MKVKAMEQFSDDNMYIIDLGEINTTPEIIFELSSVLDKDEARNRRICLKLGNVDLNQAQLLSIKSLINGIDSTLSSIDTKSVETEKIALSLGIIVSNVSAENALEVAPTMPYKMAEELKEENNKTEEIPQTVPQETELIVSAADIPVSTEDAEIEEQQIVSAIQETEDENYSIVEETDLPSSENEVEDIAKIVETNEQEQNVEQISENAEEQISDEPHIKEEEPEEPIAQNTNQVSSSDVQDELDVIFGSAPEKTSIFNIQNPSELYEDREELADIVVPEQEYTKEDIELEAFPTKYIKQTLRSGQVINYEGNVVIIGDCHPGCEITAFGDITVWGVLSGIAHAGSGGNQKARVRALKMNAIQLRIANCYSRRPDSLNTVYIEKTNSFTPEEARIINGEIVVFKMND